MAIITSTQSGDWSSGSTWVGGTTPGSADDAIIATTHTVTVSTTITVTAITINGNLTVSSTGSLTYSGNVLHDPTASGDGAVTIDGGGVLQPSGARTWTFDGTDAVHAKIATGTTGLSNWAQFGNQTATNTVYFTPLAGNTFTDIIEFDCQYMEFWRVDDGANYFINNGQQNATSASNWVLSPCFFNHCGTIRFGSGSNPGATMVFDLRNSDWRNPLYTNVVEYASNDAFTAYRGWAGSTAVGNGTVTHKFYISADSSDGIDQTNLVTRDCGLNNLFSATTDFSNFLIHEKRDNGASVLIQVSSGIGSGGSTVDNGLIYSGSTNAHTISASGTSTTQNQIHGNIMFVSDATQANPLLGADKISFQNNITVGGAGVTFAAGGSDNITIDHHTHINPADNTNGGVTFETAAYSGTIDYINSIVYQPGTTAGYAMIALAPLATQTVGTVGYNCLNNLTGTYNNVSITTDQTGNDTTVNPNFVNASATFATLDAENGGAGTIDNFFDEALKKNGRDVNGALATFNEKYSYTYARIYFTRAFRPRNTALRGVASDGGDIGALTVLKELLPSYHPSIQFSVKTSAR